MLDPRIGGTTRMAGVLLVGLVLILPLPAQAADPVALSGEVRDTLGNLLAGVEILFVEIASDSAVPVAVVHSDPAGRFTVPRILPGKYKVAALKQGYQTLVGQIDTLLQDSVKLVLHPALAVDREALAQGGSWALRLPRRGILREVDSGPGATEPEETEPADAEADGLRQQLADAMSLQFDQLFSVSAGVAERRPQDTEVEPTETHMRLASSIGERGNISVKGWHQRLAPSGNVETVDALASQDASSVSVDLAYDTSPDARLAVNAFFNQIDYKLAAGLPDAPAPLAQERQTWGYDASWSKQLDASSRVAVQVDYQDTSLVHARPEVTDALGIDPEPLAGLSNRAVSAQGAYESVTGANHEVQVVLRAELLNSPTYLWSRDGILSASGRDPLSRWNVQAEARDTWSVTAPFSLVYGLGYKHALVERDATLIVPKVGGRLSTGGWLVHALVSYHAVAGWEGSAFSGRTAPFRPEESLGFEAGLGLPLARDLRLTGGVKYEPIQLDYLGYVDGVAGADEHPLYLTDGNAAVHEHRLALVEERGPSATYLELSAGSAQGMIAPLLPFQAPLTIVSDRTLHYRNGRLGVRLPAHGADLLVEYRKVQTEGTTESGGAGESTQETVEFRARKAIEAIRAPGDWRLLLALRLGSVRSDDLEEWASYGGNESVDALNRRVSAGVSVVF